MGCTNSKSSEPSPLVALCRERRELIRAAADHRFALAAAHASYFRALDRVGDALQRFVQEELVATPSSPVLTLPPSEGKGKGKAKNTAEKSLGDEAGIGEHIVGDGGGNVGAASATFPSISHSHSNSEDSHLHLPSESDPEEEIKEERGGFVGGAGSNWMGGGSDGAAPIWMGGGNGGAAPIWMAGGRGGAAPNWIGGGSGGAVPNWMGGGSGRAAPSWMGAGSGGAASTAAPSWMGAGSGGAAPTAAPSWMGAGSGGAAPSWMGGGSGGAASSWMGAGSGGAAPSWLNPFAYPPYEAAPTPNYYYMKKSSTVPKTVYQNPYPQWSDSGFTTAYNYGSGDSYPMYGFPTESMQPPSVQNDGFYQGRETREEKAVDPPPPPPAPEVSGWDFFNPFNSYEQFIPGQLQEKYGVSSATSSPNSSEVREKEGIPDLEEETEQESMKEPVKERRVVDEDLGRRGSDAEVPNSEVTEEEKSEDEMISTEEVERASTSRLHNVEVGEDEKIVRRKKVSFDEASLVTEDTRRSKVTALSVHGTRDVMDVVKEIKEQFRSAASCGEEVSRILEASKLQYKSGNKFVKVILMKILDAILPPISTSSQAPHHESTSSLKMKSSEHALSEKYVDPGKLSSTLDKLYVWEKKLYKEVKEEEKLRVIYDKEWKHLKDLDESGAESWKIDSTRASIRTLLTRLNMIIRSINHISSRIHKLRDEELQPQLIELIHGLVKMWNSVLVCHHKQFQAMIESKRDNLMAKTGTSVAKVTIELEQELQNWCSCFSNWIHSQKAYVEYLNGWLKKWLIPEKEETPDGVVPFSPGRIGAPAAFIISNDWYHTIDRISAVEVIESMQSFAVNVHRLWETQDEEQRQKLKAEYLSKDFAKRLRSLQKKDELHVHQDDVHKVPEPVSDNNEHLHDHRMMALDAIRRRLDEERAKHVEIVKQVQQATATDLRTGLIPIFQALEDFSLDNLKAYEVVRMPNGGTET